MTVRATEPNSSRFASPQGVGKPIELRRDGGLDGDAAIALTRFSRHDTIENRAQERFAEAWGIDPVSEGPRREATHG